MLLTERYARAKRMRRGTPESADVYWFLVGARFLRKRRVKNLMFARELAVLMVSSSPAGPADERPSAALRWVKKGHGLGLLRNALVAGMSGFELRSHMSGEALLDVDAVAMLSAFKAHPNDGLTHLSASS